MKRKMVNFMKDRGFSMVGVLVAAGMAGGLSLFLAEMAKNQSQVQKRIETEAEVTAISQRIVRTLYDADACKHTLSTHATPASLPVITAGTTLNINSIRSKQDKEVFKKGSIYGNGLVKIHSLKLLNPVITGNRAEAKFEAVFEKVNKSFTGYNKKTKEYPLTLNLGAGNRLTGCVSDVSAVSEAVTQNVCSDIGGNWISSSKTCNLPDPVANKRCWGGRVLLGFDAGGNPRCAIPHANKRCTTAGQMVTGFDNNGFPECAAPSSSALPNALKDQECGAGQVLKGFQGGAQVCVNDQQGSGTPVTPPNPVANKRCTTGNVLRGFNSSGNVVCVSQSSGNNPRIADLSCPNGQAITKFVNGAPVCQEIVVQTKCRPDHARNCNQCPKQVKIGSLFSGRTYNPLRYWEAGGYCYGNIVYRALAGSGMSGGLICKCIDGSGSWTSKGPSEVIW